MSGQELTLIPGRYSILLCNIWPEKGHLLLWGFRVGRSIGHVHGTCGQAALLWRAVGQPCPVAQQSLAGAAALSSSGDYLPCPAFQPLHTRVQGISCFLKVAQAKHKIQIKILAIALTEHEKLLLKCGGFLRVFFSTDALKASSECFFSVSIAILYIWNLSVIPEKVVAPLLSRCCF